MTKLITYLQVKDLQNQFATFQSAQTRARSYMQIPGGCVLMIEVSPPQNTERLIDLVCKSAPSDVDINRQGSLLELHAQHSTELTRIGNQLLKHLGIKATQRLKPQLVFDDLIEMISERHALLLNRTMRGFKITAGESLLICEIKPAPYAALAANEVEKAMPGIKLLDLQDSGATGRLYLSGSHEELSQAREKVVQILSNVTGQDG